MDKDQVLGFSIEQRSGVHVLFGKHSDGREWARHATDEEATLYAELESLRAMRKRVAGLIKKFDGWTGHDISDDAVETYYHCAQELRAALGDSHE